MSDTKTCARRSPQSAVSLACLLCLVDLLGAGYARLLAVLDLLGDMLGILGSVGGALASMSGFRDNLGFAGLLYS